MSPEISETQLEDDIECALLAYGPDACAGDEPGVAEPVAGYGDALPGGYHRRDWQTDYDRHRCLIPRDVIDFIYATQPKEWERLKQHHGGEVKEKFIARLAREIERRGTLDVLRKGIKDSGCKFRLAYFRPVSGLNEELRRLYEANLFSVVRQLHYSEQNEKSIDLAIFLNGIPLFTAELKNPFNGQNVQDAIKQYRLDRDHREPLLKFRRCLAHFAVDPDLVYVTTELGGPKTRFLPFNRGKHGGAGNPPVPPSEAVRHGGYATAYLWNEVWARDSVLNLIQHFIHEFEEEDDKGKKTGNRRLIFPRYHQMDAVRRLVADAKSHGSGKRYLIQHSAGSGKSNSIAWLAHQLSVLHDADDRSVFDSVVVITDRRVLDRQLQRTIRQFEQTSGMVENIDQTSKQLKQALEEGKKIIVTTLQKFPVISDQMGDLPGKRFAVIVDEAHSSQSGESTKHLKSVLSADGLDEAEREDEAEPDLEDKIIEEIRTRGPLPNVSHFAFTATPKQKTLELFGTKGPDGKFHPFSLYSMRQAIEEGFILDVLDNYTTYETYWKLLKKIEDDPRFEKRKAVSLLKSYVELHPHSIDKKIEIMVDHFHSQVASKIGGKAKAMIVTRSRLHAVRYAMALKKHLEAKGYPYKSLVAFSGTVKDGAIDYTESKMNDVSEKQTARTFEGADYRFLVVANKFQTGFDQPLLHTMYVDKKLSGVNAVQTLSRLNRTHPAKEDTSVLDFANTADEIQESFQPYYEKTILSKATDPNLLHDLERELLEYEVYTDDEVEKFAAVYFSKRGTQARLYSLLEPVVERFEALDADKKREFRHQVVKYVRLYSFLSQIVAFTDTDLEKLYVFARLLRKKLKVPREELPKEIQDMIDLESLRIRDKARGKIELDRGNGKLDPISDKPPREPSHSEAPLSEIIAQLNDRFGADLSEEDRITLGAVMNQLDGDQALDAAVRTNTRENVRLTFDQKIGDRLQTIVDSNFKLYKRYADDQSFGKALVDHLFDKYMSKRRHASDLAKLSESSTLEFKSSLRWNLREQKKDPTIVTHAVLKTIAAFLNTEGGDLLIGVADDGSIIGIEVDKFDNADKFSLHLSQQIENALGPVAMSHVNPRVEIVDGKHVCVVSCDRSSVPILLRWKGTETHPEGDFFYRRGPGTAALKPENANEFVAARFPAADPPYPI
ncbi:putative DNA binding domain-containing protein [Deltaproteobacteria bacterium]|nr:putative DNA binding domain-containing protein [Deltaproteobacteria bacterium]